MSVQFSGGTPVAAATTLRGNSSGSPAVVSDLTVAQVNGMLAVGNITVRATGVNFNSANTDTAITIPLPTGFTRYIVVQARVSGASASLTTATVGLFTAAAGGGTAIVSSGTAMTISTASENAANNAQNFTIATGATQSFTAATLYFRVINPQGSAATATVTIAILPVS